MDYSTTPIRRRVLGDKTNLEIRPGQSLATPSVLGKRSHAVQAVQCQKPSKTTKQLDNPKQSDVSQAENHPDELVHPQQQYATHHVLRNIQSSSRRPVNLRVKRMSRINIIFCC